MATEILEHWVAGAVFSGESTRTSPVYNPAAGVVQREVRMATVADVDTAVQTAKAAFPDWARRAGRSGRACCSRSASCSTPARMSSPPS